MVLADGATQAAAYDPESDTFHGIASPSRFPVEVLKCATLTDGRILAIGQPTGEGSGDATGSRFSAGVLFDRGSTTSAGGGAENATEPITLAGLLYDPARDQWTYLGHLNLQRISQSIGLAPLPNGGALVIGQEAGGANGATPELFDPKTNKFIVNR